MSMFDMFSNYDQRKVANTEVSGGVVDTAEVTDCTKPYETGIQHPEYNDGNWVIVENYETIEQAREGHAKWVKVMESPPEYLDDVNECEWEQLASALGASNRGRKYRQTSQSA